MKIRKKLYILLGFLCAALPCFSASLSILISQQDNKIPELRASTVLIESGILESLFDLGHIVSTEVSTVEGLGEDVFSKTIISGKKGFMQYAVHINVVYASARTDTAAVIILGDIKTVQWKLVQTKDNSLVREEKNIIPIKYAGENDTQALKRFSQRLGFDIHIALK